MKAFLILLLTYIALSVSATFTLNRCCTAPELLVEDRQSLWRLRPDFHGAPRYFGTAPNVRPVRIDERGFRAPETDGRSIDRQRATILAVGDSFTFGWDVDDDETYPAQLQTILDRKMPGAFEVINGGVPGCSSFQAKQLLRRWIPELKPRAVIVLVGRNDGRRAFASDAEAQKLLSWKLGELNYIFPFMLLHYQGVQYFAGRLRAQPGPRVPLQEFRRNVEDIIELAKANHVKVILMEHWTRDGIFQVSGLASAHGIPYIATPQLLAREESSGKSLFIQKHYHPNKEGYALIAGALAEVALGMDLAGGVDQ